MDEQLIYFSTFSGCGGFEKAIQDVQPTAKCIGFSEIDFEIKNGKKSRVFSKVAYKNHFPTHKDYGDINAIDINSIEHFNLLVGGSPCQDLSIAKKNREGLKGERSKLFFKWLEILRIRQPKYFILENVNSMTKENKALITQYIKEIYPDVQCTMINASLVSAQSRKRLFWTNFPVSQPEDRKIFLKDILEPEVDEKYFLKEQSLTKVKFLKGKKDIIREKNGFQYHFREGEMPLTQDGQAKPLPVLASSQSIGRTTNYVDADSRIKVAGTLDEGTWAKRYEQIRRVYGTTGQSPTLPTGTGGGVIPKIIMPDKSYPIDANYQKGTSIEGYLQSKRRQIVSVGNVNPSGNGINGIDYSVDEDTKLPTLTTNKGEGNKITGCALRTRAYIGQEGQIEQREDGKAISLTSISKDSMVNDSDKTQMTQRIRRLTPIECARLQCFPDDWCSAAGLSDSAQYKAYGNAVNVEVVKHIVKCLLEAEK